MFYSLAALVLPLENKIHARVSKILFLPRENKIHIFAAPCNILYKKNAAV